jgi:hypothetical protein
MNSINYERILMKGKLIFLGLLLIFFSNIAIPQNNSELFHISIGKSIGMEDPKKYSGLLGYSVQFPESISSSHILIDISLGIGLSKQVTQAEGKVLEEKMTKAIDDKVEFAALKKYNPFRTMGGFYSNKDRTSIIVVATMPVKAFVEIESKGKTSGDAKAKEIVIENIKCNWTHLDEDNKYHSLTWSKSGVSYMIFPIEGKDFTLDDATDIAKKIIDINK